MRRTEEVDAEARVAHVEEHGGRRARDDHWKYERNRVGGGAQFHIQLEAAAAIEVTVRTAPAAKTSEQSAQISENQRD